MARRAGDRNQTQDKKSAEFENDDSWHEMMKNKFPRGNKQLKHDDRLNIPANESVA